MSNSENKNLVRRLYIEVFTKQESSAIDALIASDITVHDPLMGDMHGIQAFRQFAAAFTAGFPEQYTTVATLIEEGDLVASLHTHTAINTGSFMGLPPTGRTVNVQGLELFRIENGKIAELWRHDDDAGLMRQLGLIPSAESVNA